MTIPKTRNDRAPIIAATCAVLALFAAGHAEAQSNGGAAPAGEQALTPEQKAKIEEMKARRKKFQQPDGAPNAATNGGAQPQQNNQPAHIDKPPQVTQPPHANQPVQKYQPAQTIEPPPEDAIRKKRRRPIEQATPPPANQPPPANTAPPPHQAAPYPTPNRNVDMPAPRKYPPAQPQATTPAESAGKVGAQVAPKPDSPDAGNAGTANPEPTWRQWQRRRNNPGAFQRSPAQVTAPPNAGRSPALPSDMSAMKRERRQIINERTNSMVIREPDNRTIIKKGGRTIIVHDETNRIRRLDPRAEVQTQSDGTNVTVIRRPNNVQIFNVTDKSGQLVRRYRRDAQGHEFDLIDNRRRKHNRFGRNLAIGLGIGAGVVAGAAILEFHGRPAAAADRSAAAQVHRRLRRRQRGRYL